MIRKLAFRFRACVVEAPKVRRLHCGFRALGQKLPDLESKASVSPSLFSRSMFKEKSSYSVCFM